MLFVKILLNSVVLMPGTKFLCIDKKNFSLNMPLKKYKHLQIKLTNILKDIVNEYKLHKIVMLDGYVYLEVCKKCMGWHRQSC